MLSVARLMYRVIIKCAGKLADLAVAKWLGYYLLRHNGVQLGAVCLGDVFAALVGSPRGLPPWVMLQFVASAPSLGIICLVACVQNVALPVQLWLVV